MPRLVTLPMRCSASGKKFYALCEWDVERRKYVLQRTVAAKPEPPDLGRFARTLTNLFSSTSRQSGGRDTPSLPLDAATDFDLREFHFDGFSCPLCGYGEAIQVVNDTSFVKCGKCEELVCGRRIAAIRGSLVFRCYEQCGHEGEMSGPITSAKGLVDASANQVMNAPPEPRANPALKATVEIRAKSAIKPPVEPVPRAALDTRRPENDQLPGPPSRGLPPPDRKR